MEENLQMGLSMLVIGMITVFFMLFFVVAGGKLLIRWVNRYYPLEEKVVSFIKEKKDDSRIAAIVAAVEIATSGKGKVSSIRKSVK